VVSAVRHRVISPADAELPQSYVGLWLRQARGLGYKSALVACGRPVFTAVRLLLPVLLALIIYLTIQFAGNGSRVQVGTGDPLAPIPRCVPHPGVNLHNREYSCSTVLYAPANNSEVEAAMQRFALTQPALSWPEDFEAVPVAALRGGVSDQQPYTHMQKYLDAHQNYTLGAVQFGLNQRGHIDQYYVYYNDSTTHVEQDLIGRSVSSMQNNYRLQLVASVEAALTDLYWDVDPLVKQQVHANGLVNGIGNDGQSEAVTRASSPLHTLKLSVSDFPTLGTMVVSSGLFVFLCVSFLACESLYSFVAFCISSSRCGD
jgi:hypothetical protein